MNRTDRLLAIVLELQARGWTRAEDLAAHFEVSKRTIYRDLEALGESGVPVVAQAGRGYSLDEDYFLPPLHFTPDEALLLLLGADFMTQQFDAQYQAVAQSAAAKITTILPQRLRQQVESIAARLRFIASTDNVAPETLQKVRLAIVEGRRLHFGYTSPTGSDVGDWTERDADPYALVHHDNIWMLIAYCHLRHDERKFRLDRMSDVRVLTRTFTLPPDYRLQEQDTSDRQLIVRVRFPLHMAPWVREERNFYTVAEAETTDAYIVTLHARRETDVLRWVLGWGAHAEVLEPIRLRERIHEEAERILQKAETLDALLT